MAVRMIATYQDCETKRVVQFFPVKNVPGFKYRVVINGQPVDWSVRCASKIDAEFFLKKHS